MPKKKMAPVPEVKAPAEQTTLVSTISSMVSSAASFTYAYLTTPAPFPPKPTNGRHITSFEANIVASVALPEQPKPLPKACKKFNTYATHSSFIYSALSNTVSFFSWALTAAPKKEAPLLAPPTKIRVPGVNDIDVRMKKLVVELNTMKYKDPIKVEEIYLQQIDLLEYEIMEHAQRRVDLYFYLLVAVYKQNANIVKVFTQKQHGAGTNESGTNACHDSLFPNVLLQYPQTKLSYLWTAFVTPWAFAGTHFEDANNMTTELPAIVNEFDTYMEAANPGQRSVPSKYVKKMLVDLNLVSRGEMTPIDAMNSFLAITKLFFSEFEAKLDGSEMPSKRKRKRDDCEEKVENIDPYKFPHSMHRAMRKIWELQLTGTLRAKADNEDCVDHDYLCSLLRVPPDQVLKTRQDPLLLLNYYCPIIQKEIFTTKSVIGPDRKIIKPLKMP